MLRKRFYFRYIFFSLFIIITSVFAQNNPTSISVNVSGINDWATQLVFVDALKSARPWLPQLVSHWTWDTGDTLDLDANGWVKSLKDDQAAGTIMLVEQNGNYPGGDYICLYEGEGELEFNWDAEIVSQSPGRIVVHVEPSNDGIYMKQIATNPENYMRNIRLIMPGYEETYASQPYFPPVLDILGQFSNLRFMWWNNAVDSPVQEWSERTPPNHYTYQDDRGVPYEVMIDLANTLHVNPWFCLPHLASDDYIAQFAALVRDSLNPELKAYIEYGNEVWNGIYECANYAREQGMALELATDVGYNEFTAQMRFYSQRSVEIFNICEQIFGGTDRMVRVLGGWSQSEYTAEVVLEWQDAWQHADAYAIAPYFGHYLGDAENADWVASMSAAEIVDSTYTDMLRVMQANLGVKSIVDEKGLNLICYEAGQHLVGAWYQTGAVIDSLFQAANRHPNMYNVYMAYYQQWQELFGGLMSAYASCERWSQYGSWGLLEYWNQPAEEAPKWRATMDFINKVSSIDIDHETHPQSFILAQNYPNPFNANTQIEYILDSPAHVNLGIYNQLGQRVKVLHDERQDAGAHKVLWHGTDDQGVPVSSGIYYYEIQIDGQQTAKKMLLLK